MQGHTLGLRRRDPFSGERGEQFVLPREFGVGKETLMSGDIEVLWPL